MCSVDIFEAASNGDVEFLRNCVASNKPTEYYLTQHPRNEGNFLHSAVYRNKLEFIKETIKILPLETIQLLIADQRNEERYNLIHVAAYNGRLDIVKVLLDVYRSSTSLPDPDNRPWLAIDIKGFDPCKLAIIKHYEDCGLEIWKMDKELISMTQLLLDTMLRGLDNFALELLRSPYSFTSTDSQGFTALHYVVHCSSDEILKELLSRDPGLIKKKSELGDSILHHWAAKLWPFECLLRCSDIIQNVREIFVELMCETDELNGFNPFHILARQLKSSSGEDTSIKIAKLLINTYKQEVVSLPQDSKDMMVPWLMGDKQEHTPLYHAIVCENEPFAKYILLEDNNALLKAPDALILAIENKCQELAVKILRIMDDQGWTDLITNQQLMNALDRAPKHRSEFVGLLISYWRTPLLEKVNRYGTTVLHTWVNMGEVWPFECILQNEYITREYRNDFVKRVISVPDVRLNNPLHIAASSTHETTYQIVKLLIHYFKQEVSSWTRYSYQSLPWFTTNSSGDGPLHLAMRNQREKLVLYFLSLVNNSMSELLDYYKPEHQTLFLAVENNCFQVAREILTKLDKASWSKYVTNPSDGRSILHLAPYCKDKEFGRWLVQEALEFIGKKNNRGDTPLDEASDVGAAWIIQSMLENDPSAFYKTPLAWLKACENGHASAVRAFIDYYPGKFSDHCIEYQDSPLHHIKLRNLTMYEEFLQIPRMEDLINVQDSQGATPLHKAIQNENIFLTEALLKMDKIKYNINDHENRTARDLLNQKYMEQYKWKQMCRSIGFDPTIKTTYFQNKANLLDVRNTLSLVAALLATITFTAGFTLPGGFDQNNGQAMLAKKAAFLVFLISDTLAMCCSMLILICLVWSMIYDPNKSLVLIDRSMKLLIISIYSTLLAFMTGVYVVISPKSFWAAILVIVMCSLLGVFANMDFLTKVLDKLFSRGDKEESQRDLMQQLEEGLLLKHPEENSQGVEFEEIRMQAD